MILGARTVGRGRVFSWTIPGFVQDNEVSLEYYFAREEKLRREKDVEKLSTYDGTSTLGRART